jgi:hypothetical protein
MCLLFIDVRFIAPPISQTNTVRQRIVMPALSSLLGQIAKKASHPNDLVYKLQLTRAKQKYLVQERLGVSREDSVALQAPKEELEEELEEGEAAIGIKKEKGMKAVQREDAEVKRGKTEMGQG